MSPRKINALTAQRSFDIKEPLLREQIRGALAGLAPTEASEQYCQYSFRFEDGRERLHVKQYTSGKLVIQGHDGPLYRRLVAIIVARCDEHHPDAAGAADTGGADDAAGAAIAAPYIGTDESGKGDYFGPLVVAAVWADEATQKRLQSLGVRDSKTVSDHLCRKLAAAVRDVCADRHEEVEMSPERYNSLYEEFRREGKNLNHLLAWGHARALETLVARCPSERAIADKFGDEKYIRARLMEKGRTLELVQTPKAERYIAVAAASILARDRFLRRLAQLGHQIGVRLPKGASAEVVEAARAVVERGGREALHRVAKIHFKTTAAIR